MTVKKGEEKDEIFFHTIDALSKLDWNSIRQSLHTIKSKESRSFFHTIDALSKLDWNSIRQSLHTIMEEAGKAVKGAQTQEQTKNE